jgi:single-strand DNA-binding protein
MIKVTAVGCVGKDAELKYTQSGKAVADFSIAVNMGKDAQGNDRTMWVKAVLWEKRAEGLAQYIKKGIYVAVSGRPTTEAWVGKQDGEIQSKLVINVEDFTFAGKSGGGNGGANRDEQAQAPAPRQSAVPGGPITDEDIPF